MLSPEIRHVLRSAWSRRSATLASVAVLGVGVGLVGTVAGLADPFLAKPVPYLDADRLAIVRLVMRRDNPWAAFGGVTSGPSLTDLAARRDLFEAIAAHRGSRDLRIRDGERTIALTVQEVSPNFLQVLLGRRDLDRAAVPGVTPLVLTAAAGRRLSHDEGDARLSTSDGGRIEVAGATPEDFYFPFDGMQPPVQAMSPMTDFASLARRPIAEGGTALTLVGRLAPGADIDQVRAYVSASMAETGMNSEVVAIEDYVTRRLRPHAYAAVLAGIVMLLICAGNLANSLLARALHRSQEFATREALGASTTDNVRLLGLEVALLAASSAVVALFLAHSVLALLARIMPVDYTRLGEPALNWRIALVCIAAAGAAGLLAMAAVRLVWSATRRGLFGQFAGLQAPRLRVLRMVSMTVQSALAMVAVALACFLTRSYYNLAAQETGLSESSVVITISYDDQHAGAPLHRDIEAMLARIRSLPGVAGAAASSGPFLDRYRLFFPLVVRGEQVSATSRRVTPGYFEAAGTSIVAGRDFEPGDAGRGRVVINESLADRFWSQPPIGERIGPRGETEIIGVARDAMHLTWDQPPGLTVYSLLDNPSGCSGSCNRITYLVTPIAGVEGPVTSTAAVQRLAQAINPDSVIVDISTIGQRLGATVQLRTFATVLLAFFSAASALIAAAGIAGIVAFTVSRRTRDIAIAMSMGAPAQTVLRSVSGEALLSTALGLFAGILVSGWMTTLLGSYLFGLPAADVPTLIAAAVLLACVALFASLVPAQRALRISPMEALRSE